jgi:hypothetical protein
MFRFNWAILREPMPILARISIGSLRMVQMDRNM